MPTIDFSIEDQDGRFQVDMEETPRTGEFVTRGGRTFVVASVTWELSRRSSSARIILRELPPPP